MLSRGARMRKNASYAEQDEDSESPSSKGGLKITINTRYIRSESSDDGMSDSLHLEDNSVYSGGLEEAQLSSEDAE